MKKILLICISLIICITFTACGFVVNSADILFPKDTANKVLNTNSDDIGIPTVSPDVKRNKPLYQVTERTIILDYKVPEHLKKNYIILCNALEEQVEKIEFYSDITGSLDLLIYYANSYNPHLYYVDWGDLSYITKSFENVVKQTNIMVKYKNNSSSDDIRNLERKVDEIIAGADKKENLFEKELYVHDYLIENIEYDINTEHAGDIYGALIEGKAKCDGYSKAFQYIMNRLGIETVSVTGNTGERHMWNMVRLENKYYFVDVTHDDPIYELGDSFHGERIGENSCFNVPDRILKVTHEIDPVNDDSNKGFITNLDLQPCNSLEYNYYMKKGMAVNNLAEFEEILNMYKETEDVEVFFIGDMPTVDEIVNTFKSFMKKQNSISGYKFYYTNQSDNSYKHNVFRISWHINQ